MKRVINIIHDTDKMTIEVFEKTLSLILKHLLNEAKFLGLSAGNIMEAVLRQVYSGLYWVFFHGTKEDNIELFEKCVVEILSSYLKGLKIHLQEDEKRRNISKG